MYVICHVFITVVFDLRYCCFLRYGVKVNNAILAEPSHVPMYAELAALPGVEYIAGGATQNTIRVAQWMIQQPNATVYTGCVGADSFGEQLRKSAESDGVKVLYQVNAEQPTGTCGCLIVNKERSLIANLAAANHFKPEHLDTEALQQAINQAQIFYSAGFFLTVSPPSLMKVAEHAHANKKTFAVNLSAPFIPQFFTEPLVAAIEYADYVFGNESEAEAFAQKQGWEDTSAEFVAVKLSQWTKKNADRPRVAVITQGSKQTVVAINGQIQTFAVPALDSSRIVDVNGAGDAFVGGFLSQLALGRDLSACVKAGHYASRIIIQTSGTALTGTPDANHEQQ